MTTGQDIIIYIGTWKFLSVMAGIVLTAWYAGNRIGGLEARMSVVESAISNISARIDNLYNGRSPVALLSKGVKILEGSGLKKWIDKNEVILLERCHSAYVMDNAYDVQTAAFAFFDKLDFPSDVAAALKDSAFQNGVSIENIRRIGGIYFRDICLGNMEKRG